MTTEEGTQPPQKSSEASILDIVDRSHEEIMWVRSAYKFAVSIIAILIAIGLYFSHKSIQDLKADLRADGEHIQEQLKIDSALLARALQQNLEDEVGRIRREVTARIEDEFKQENISSLVEKEAQARIDVIADDLIETQIAEQITPLRAELTTLISTSSTELQTKINDVDHRRSISQEQLRKNFGGCLPKRVVPLRTSRNSRISYLPYLLRKAIIAMPSRNLGNGPATVLSHCKPWPKPLSLAS